MSTKVFKIVTLGDGAVGKTCLLQRYVDDAFDERYAPTVFDEKQQTKTIYGQERTFKLIDTAGQEEFENIRKAAYDDVDAYLLCFSVDDRTSFDNIEPFWMAEIPDSSIPIVLCGTKTDLRDDESRVCVTKSEGRELQVKIKAKAYVECSAKTNDGVGATFDTVIEQASVAYDQRQDDAPKTNVTASQGYQTFPKPEPENKGCCVIA